MYYEEKVINGILCWRGDPHGEWHEMDYVELLNHYDMLSNRSRSHPRLESDSRSAE